MPQERSKLGMHALATTSGAALHMDRAGAACIGRMRLLGSQAKGPCNKIETLWSTPGHTTGKQAAPVPVSKGTGVVI